MVVRSVPSRVAVTVAFPASALLTGQVLRSWLHPSYDPVFFAAVAGVAALCGVRYAIAAAVLSAVAYSFSHPLNGLRLFLFLAASGLIITLVHYARAARDELMESERRYRSLTELIPFGGWIADGNGNMIQLSETFLKTFSTTMDQCRGLGWIDLFDEADRPQVLSEWQATARTGYFWDYEYRIRDGAGQTRAILSRGIPVESAAGRRRSWVGIHLDITDLEHSAEQRVEQARDLARFNAELEQFAYVSAHDLQEPLRMIASYLQLLARRYHGKLDGDADAYIGFAVEGAERLQSLLQDLLQLQQVGKGNKPRPSAPLENAVRKAAANLTLRAAEVNARITWADLPVLEYEEQAFTELFTHLFENAMKYHRDGVPPEVNVSASRITPNLWEVRVRDNGIGIPPEFEDKIFNVFQRLHPRARYPGTGIGLAICKKVVEVHGGRIHVEPAAGGGSVFCFTVPVNSVQVNSLQIKRGPVV